MVIFTATLGSEHLEDMSRELFGIQYYNLESVFTWDHVHQTSEHRLNCWKGR
jgi:hypothetical protein